MGYKLRYIYPTKEQRLEEEKLKLSKNPKTKEEAMKNKEVQERIRKIEGVF